MGDIAKYFNRSDFACKCGCGFDDIDMELVKILDRLRDITGHPMIINCGCRCPKHNKEVNGKENSAHLRGKAADIKMPGSQYRHVFLTLAYRIFKRIGIYSTFVHVDIDKTLPQNVTWTGKG